MKNLFLYILPHIITTVALTNDTCKWCTYKDASITKELQSFSTFSPRRILDSIKNKNIEVLVLKSGRNIPANTFSWNKVLPATGTLNEVTSLKKLMGKTLCKGEHKLSSKKHTIILASDAPKSTLLHEYLHVLQIQKDNLWCSTSKKLWQRLPNKEEKRQRLDREWDVLKTLWTHLKDLNLNIEDKISIAHELIEQSQKRSSFDQKASHFISQQKIHKFLKDKISIYTNSLQNKKSGISPQLQKLKKIVSKTIFKAPTLFTQKTYCYFVFQEVIDPAVITPDLFAKYVKGGSLSLKYLKDYSLWLDTKPGLSCKKSIGKDFQLLDTVNMKKKYAIFLNTQAIKDEGKSVDTTKNHELLHIAFAEYPEQQSEIAKVWEKRSEKMKKTFIDKHPGYNFKNKKILLREFFSYTFEKNLEAGLQIMMGK